MYVCMYVCMYMYICICIYGRPTSCICPSCTCSRSLSRIVSLLFSLALPPPSPSTPPSSPHPPCLPMKGRKHWRSCKLSQAMAPPNCVCVCVCDVAGGTCNEPYVCMLFVRCLNTGSFIVGTLVFFSFSLFPSLALALSPPCSCVCTHTSL